MNTSATPTETAPREVVQAVYAAFERGDIPAVLELFDPKIEISQSSELPWGGTHRGHEGALEFFGTLTAHIRTSVAAERMIVAGDTVVEIGRTEGHAVESGREFSIDEAHVWEVRDGRIVSMRAYVDNEAMLAAIAN